MSKRKKKNAVTLISLLLLLAVLIGGYVWYGDWKKNSAASDEDKTTDSIELGTLDSTQLSSIHYTAKDADLTLSLQDGVWKSDKDPNRPINQSNVSNLVNLITDIKASKLVTETPSDLGEYGLATPTASLQAAQKDGKTLTLKIGNEAIGGKGYYAVVNDDKKVYLVDSKYGSGLEYTDTDMTAVESGPTITAENIRHILIDNRDNPDFEILYKQGNLQDLTGLGLNPWVLLKPYDEGYSVDSTKVNDILPNYASFTFNACVNYDSKDLSEYGLDKPLASIYLQYYETKTEPLPTPEVDSSTGQKTTEKTVNVDKEYKIYIGNQDDNGDYYVKTDTSNAVYTMSADTIDKMLQVKPFDLLSTLIALPNIENVDQITIDINGVPYTMSMQRSTEKKSDGTDETKVTYFYNGKTVDEETFKGVYQSLISAKYDAEVKGEVNTTGVKPVMTISYHLIDKNSNFTVSFLPYNDSFYLVDAGNKIRFMADKRAIDQVAQIVKDFKAPKTNN